MSITFGGDSSEKKTNAPTGYSFGPSPTNASPPLPPSTKEEVEKISKQLFAQMTQSQSTWENLTEMLTKQQAEFQEMKVSTETELAAKREVLYEDVARDRKQLTLDQSQFDENVKQWQEQQEKFKSTYNFQNKIVKLNVGGEHMSTRLQTLQNAGGFLSSLFSGRFEPDYDENGAVFIDLDGSNFKEILNLLRHSSVPLTQALPQRLKNAMKYLQVGSELLFEEYAFEKGTEFSLYQRKDLMVIDKPTDLLISRVGDDKPKEWVEVGGVYGVFSNRDILNNTVDFQVDDEDKCIRLIVIQEPSVTEDHHQEGSCKYADDEEWANSEIEYEDVEDTGEICFSHVWYLGKNPSITLSGATFTSTVRANVEDRVIDIQNVECHHEWN